MDAVFLSSHRLREKTRRLRDIIGQYKYLVRDQDSDVFSVKREQPAFSVSSGRANLKVQKTV